MLGDVGQPQAILGVDGELAMHQVILGRRTGRAAPAAAPVEALHTGGAHETSDALVVDLEAEAEDELGVDPRPAVRSAGLFVNLDDLLGQQRIRLLSRRRWPAEPVVVARSRYAQNSTGHRDIDTHFGVIGHFTDQSER